MRWEGWEVWRLCGLFLGFSKPFTMALVSLSILFVSIGCVGWEFGGLEAVQKPAKELARIGEAKPEAKGQIDGKHGKANSIGGEVGIKARLIQQDEPGDWQQTQRGYAEEGDDGVESKESGGFLRLFHLHSLRRRPFAGQESGMADHAVKNDWNGQRRQCRKPVKLVEHREPEEADWFHDEQGVSGGADENSATFPSKDRCTAKASLPAPESRELRPGRREKDRRGRIVPSFPKRRRRKPK